MIKVLQAKKQRTKLPTPGPIDSAQNLPDVQRRINAMLLKLFHKSETEGTFPNSIYKALIILIPKPHKNLTTKIGI